MSRPSARDSIDGSESNFSLVEHAYADESLLSEGGASASAGVYNGRAADAGIKAYYPISTILSNPRAASAAQTISTNLSNLNPLRATTGPKTGATRGRPAAPVVLSELPKVSRKSFDAYIASIKEDYTAWSRIQSALADAPILVDLDDEEDGHLDEEAAQRRKAIRRALEGSSINLRGAKKLQLPPLSSIPAIFFEENFNLANPRTFDVVTGDPDGAQSVASGAASSADQQKKSLDLANDQILQEKLAHWLDIVELHLTVEISMRSASFFSALSNLQELDSQSAEAVKQISQLKERLAFVDSQVARKGLTAVRQGLRRRRLHDLDAGLERIKEILKAVDQAEELGEAGETEGALDLADELGREWESSLARSHLDAIPPTPAVEKMSNQLMASIGEEDEAEDVSTAIPPRTPATALGRRNEQHPPVRIANINCMSTIPARLDRLRLSVAHTLDNEFLAVLVHALREGTNQLVSDAASWRQDPAASHHNLDVLRAGVFSHVRSSLRGLIRCGKPALDASLLAWKEAMLKETKRRLRDELPASSAADDEDNTVDQTSSSRTSIDSPRSQTGAEHANLQQMSGSEYSSLMNRTHTSMLALLVHMNLQGQAISQTVDESLKVQVNKSHSSVASTEEALNDAWKISIQSNLTDTVQATAETINVRLARVVASRADIHSSLPLGEFWRTFQDSWQFVLDCETICKKMIVGLRGVVVGQAKAFLQQIHQSMLTEMAHAVEQEQWSPVDVPDGMQKTVDRILESAVDTPQSWDLNKNTSLEAGSTATAKQLQIEDRTYFAVPATLATMRLLENYLKIVINLSLLSTDALSRIIEFLKQFNSRVCQMVLGAGAMRSAGLKNITAKHLAMASQTTSILINVIPYTRECMRRHLRVKQAVILVDFDKLKRDCQEHQNEIHAKLVAIMGDRLAVHCKSLQEIDWEKDAGQTGRPNSYMETLVKETGTLHKVLLKYLPGSALEVVMMQVLSSINSRLAEEYNKIVLKSSQAKDRLHRDSVYLKDRFAELKGLERTAPGAELEQLVLDKKIEISKPRPQQQGRQFSTPSLTQARKSLSSHQRTPSAVAALEAMKATQEPVIGENPEEPTKAGDESPQAAAVVPLDDANVSHAPFEVQRTTSSPKPVEIAEVDATSVPLPASPDAEQPPMTIEQTLEISEQTGKTSSDAVATEAPATPVKDPRIASPPLPEKVEIVQPPRTVTTPPPSRVQNRLAGLFAKRPSIPTVEDTPIVESLTSSEPVPASANPVAHPSGSAEGVASEAAPAAESNPALSTEGTHEPQVLDPEEDVAMEMQQDPVAAPDDSGAAESEQAEPVVIDSVDQDVEREDEKDAAQVTEGAKVTGLESPDATLPSLPASTRTSSAKEVAIDNDLDEID